MKKVLIVALTAMGFGVAVPSAMAADAYVVRVYCKDQTSYDVVIKANSGGDAEKIASRQNPGCKVILTGKAKK